MVTGFGVKQRARHRCPATAKRSVTVVLLLTFEKNELNLGHIFLAFRISLLRHADWFAEFQKPDVLARIALRDTFIIRWTGKRPRLDRAAERHCIGFVVEADSFAALREGRVTNGKQDDQ